jgi:4-hydroxybenzoate polyprenyltransferase
MPPLLKLLRPHQWAKNVFCFAGVIFGTLIADPHAHLKALAVFGLFCAASSAIYVYNDIRDRDRDRLHPRKRERPIARGQVPVSQAALVGLVLAVLAVAGALLVDWCILTHSPKGGGITGKAVLPPWPVTLSVAGYLFLNLCYTVELKHRPIIDVNCVAGGFVLRLLAGIWVLGDTPTVWIVLCTFTLALLLAIAKRRAEFATSDPAHEDQRPVLLAYTLPFLDSLINSAATVTVIGYAPFTVLSGKNPTLFATVPIVYYAVMRSKLLTIVRGQSEEPEKNVLKDKGIVAAGIIWILFYLAIVHGDVRLFR